MSSYLERKNNTHDKWENSKKKSNNECDYERVNNNTYQLPKH